MTNNEWAVGFMKELDSMLNGRLDFAFDERLGRGIP